MPESLLRGGGGGGGEEEEVAALFGSKGCTKAGWAGLDRVGDGGGGDDDGEALSG